MSTQSPAKTPLLIIVTGPPASGKSTLGKQIAAGLGLPYLAKDDIKETLYDSLGRIERAISGKLGQASMRLLYTVARRVMEAGVGVVIEANFECGVSEGDLSSMLSLENAIMIHCAAPDAELTERYAERAESDERHPVHSGAGGTRELEKDMARGVYEPLDLDLPVIRVDTSGDADPSVAEIVSRIQSGSLRD